MKASHIWIVLYLTVGLVTFFEVVKNQMPSEKPVLRQESNLTGHNSSLLRAVFSEASPFNELNAAYSSDSSNRGLASDAVSSSTEEKPEKKKSKKVKKK